MDPDLCHKNAKNHFREKKNQQNKLFCQYTLFSIPQKTWFSGIYHTQETYCITENTQEIFANISSLKEAGLQISWGEKHLIFITLLPSSNTWSLTLTRHRNNRIQNQLAIYMPHLDSAYCISVPFPILCCSCIVGVNLYSAIGDTPGYFKKC